MRFSGRAAGMVGVVTLLAAPGCLLAQGLPLPTVDGYALYVYAPPGWHWLPSGGGGQVAQAAAEGDGCRLEFVIPLADLPDLDPGKARVGLVAGFTANGPITWLKVGEAVRGPANPSPLEAPIFGQAGLSEAQVQLDGGKLEARMRFAAPPVLETAWDLMGLVDADGDPTTGYRGAEWLLQSCPLGGEPKPGLRLAWLEAAPGVVERGRAIRVRACLLNDGAEPAEGLTVALRAPASAKVQAAQAGEAVTLEHGGTLRLEWTVRMGRTGLLPLRVVVSGPGRALQRTRWCTVVARRDPRHEFQTAEGDWLRYPERRTLQAGNTARLTALEGPVTGPERRNLMGITAHLPRSLNDEDPFLAAHAVDGDPATCWASRWWRLAAPLEPEWLQADLGRITAVAQVRFLPAWRNSGMPGALRVEVSRDGKRWETVADEARFAPVEAPQGSAERVGEVSWQRLSFASRPARYVRLTSERLNQGGTSFFCAPYEPFQFRLAEVTVADAYGTETRPVRARASSVHQAWYNSPESVTRTWPKLLQSGVGLNRIGQWGDRTDWASVERERGLLKVPEEVDRAVAQSRAAGVETLLTLCYGNNVYQSLENPVDHGPGWHLGHPFWQCAPTRNDAVEAFARYCGFMARHFRNTVRYFEVWNEENGWFFDDWSRGGHISQVKAYGRALMAAAQAIKREAPEAVVVFGGTAGSSLDYPRIALEEGAGPWVDVFAFHPYGHPTPEAAPDNFLTLVGENMEWRARPEGVGDYEEEIAAFRRALRPYNPEMGIWADEMNWFAPGEPALPGQGDQSELTQAKHLARFCALNTWLGCGAVWWSLYNANRVQEWAVLRSSDMSPRAAWWSARYTATILNGARAARDVGVKVHGEVPADLMVKVFRNAKREVLVGLWRTSFGADTCQPVAVDLELPSLRAESVELVDLLYGVRQPANVGNKMDGLSVSGIVTGDWPVFLRFRRAGVDRDHEHRDVARDTQ